MTLVADEAQKSDTKKVEDLLSRRKALEAEETKLRAKVNPRLTEVSTDITDIDLELLELAETNKQKWWPDTSKTKEFDGGKLVWRAGSAIVTENDESVTEINTDLLALAKKNGFRNLVKLTPVMGKIKALIEIGKMPKGFENLRIKVKDTFSVNTKD